jgi:hypothetical protein
MIVKKGFKFLDRNAMIRRDNDGPHIDSWVRRQNSYCAGAIRKIFGRLDKSATYEARFYNKRPRTKVIKLLIQRAYCFDHPRQRLKVGISRGCLFMISGGLRDVWNLAKKDGKCPRTRTVYVRLVKTSK